MRPLGLAARSHHSHVPTSATHGARGVRATERKREYGSEVAVRNVQKGPKPLASRPPVLLVIPVICNGSGS